MTEAVGRHRPGPPPGRTAADSPTTPTANGFGLSFEHIDMNARTNAGTQVGNEGVRAPTSAIWMHFDGLDGSVVMRADISGLNDVEAIDFNALGTQIGSEGVRPRA